MSTTINRTAKLTFEPAAEMLLENGDRLTRAEFERRYTAMPFLKKAELIEGKVYMPSPVRMAHGAPHALLMTWAGVYCASTPDVQFADNATVRLDLDNELQPDLLLRLDSAMGSTSVISADDYIEGPPELVVEIAASSVSYALHDKLNVYRRSGVQEYLVWRVYDRQLDWWKLQDGVYVPLAMDEAGIIRSTIFPGLWLSQSALLEGKLGLVLETVQHGLASEEHAAFVMRQ